MKIAKILAAASGDPEARAAMETAFRLGQRYDAHIEVINVRRNPRDAVAFMTEGMTGAVIEEIISTAEQDIDNRSHHAQQDFQALCKDLGIEQTTKPVAGKTSASFHVEDGREDEVIAERGRLSDLVIAARPGAAGDAKEEVVAESVLMESGSGLLLVPPGKASDLNGPAAIAWNGSAEAARAVHRAMPLLLSADSVAIMCPEESSMRGPSAEALTDYLALHDIKCHNHRLPGDWTHIGEALLSTAHEENASFIVMGAFSQGKLRQLILGGATRFMLNKADVPVLFTH